MSSCLRCPIFSFHCTSSSERYTLSLHDALPISSRRKAAHSRGSTAPLGNVPFGQICGRSEEHTSELQSRGHLVCRLLLEKKNVARPRLIWIQTRTANRTSVLSPTRSHCHSPGRS